MFDSSFAAFYFPWVLVEGRDKPRAVPPSGHIAGVFARLDADSGVHHPPANQAIEGVVDVERALLEDDIGYLNSKGINCIKYFPMRGIRVWGARTVSSDTALRYVNVRRVISTIIRSMVTNLQWVVFEPNSPKVWKTLEREVTHFLYGLWQRGFFRGAIPEDAFYVKCDYETNPLELRNAGILVVEVGVAPVRPAEYLVFRVEQEVEEVGPGSGSQASTE
jgi:phage tail sheath protein FI